MILLSGGRDDLIDALQVPIDFPPHKRLLKTPDERVSSPTHGSGYISEAGWTTFAQYVQASFRELLDVRDSGVNRYTPLVWHNYARMMPRPAGMAPDIGPWLLPVFERYQVPASDWLIVSDELMERLGAVLNGIVHWREANGAHRNLYMIDSRSVGLVVAAPASTGSSGDWINEIHPTSNGYQKAAAAWSLLLHDLLA